MDDDFERLASLYAETHKHSAYQVLPSSLERLLRGAGVSLPEGVGKSEEARLDFIRAHMPLLDKRIVDIGGNTGYFSIRCAELGAREVLCIEGNSVHAQFLCLALQTLGLAERVQVKMEYFTGDLQLPGIVDGVFLLNVLHHLGDDFGPGDLGDRGTALDSMADMLNSLSTRTRWLVLQLGFNWMGRVDLPLFEHGEKREMIDFVRAHCAGVWDVQAIGIAQRDVAGKVAYADLDQHNIRREDSLGEFLNRPLFILKSLHAETHAC